MLDKLQSLSSLGISDMGSSSDCKCNSNSTSGMFDMVLVSLLNAMKEKNKSAGDESEKLSLDNLINNFNNVTINEEELNSDERIEAAIDKYSKQYGVDGKLIKAIIKQESNFDPNAVSSAGAKGLMQLMPENCTALGVTDPLDIEQNIEGGVKHIKEYIDRYNGDVEMALMAYNGGPTRMMNRGVNSINDIYKMPKETQNYVPKVMSYYRGW